MIYSINGKDAVFITADENDAVPDLLVFTERYENNFILAFWDDKNNRYIPAEIVDGFRKAMSRRETYRIDKMLERYPKIVFDRCCMCPNRGRDIPTCIFVEHLTEAQKKVYLELKLKI